GLLENESKQSKKRYEKHSVSQFRFFTSFCSILVGLWFQLASILASENDDFLEIPGFKEAFKT
ncbi:MAG: hypothetical protein VX075_16875, partial [Pseudomonadota bacterium]|nr:hypothetical protein [Pseudomonadota bacterium]